MRRQSLTVVAALLTAACANHPTASGDRPQFELADPTQAPVSVNAIAKGSFTVNASGSGTMIITSGPANFPGHPPAGPGTCSDGLWINSAGKPTTGGMSKPHPHCIKPAAAIEVKLEPIHVCTDLNLSPPDVRAPVCIALKATKGQVQHVVRFGGDTNGFYDVTGITDNTTDPPTLSTEGSGIVVGYAVNATTNERVGTLTFDLTQYASTSANYFDGVSCAVDPTVPSPCLDLRILASYAPLPSGGVGSPDGAVEGFLWLEADPDLLPP